MWHKEKKDSLIVNLALLLTLATTPVAAVFFVSESAFSQSSETTETTSFPLPENVPSGTTVRVDSSNSMAEITQALKQSFEKKYSSTNVEISTNDASKAIKSVIDGDVDIAAIGRGLTPEEEKQGLEQVRLRREKIAIIVSKDNPFNRSLTNDQFAQIFRGEVTDWSELGGSSGKIRFIDYPESSETREAFRNYPVFNKVKFTTGETASQLENDNVAEAIKKLGKDGIGYVVSNQVSKLDDVRVLKMHQILPDDARYPYSQPLVYVYKKNSANSPAVKSFLGFAIAPIGQEAVEKARTAQAVAIANELTGNSDTAANNLGNTNSENAEGKQNAENSSGNVSNVQNSVNNINSENADGANNNTATEIKATNSTTTKTAENTEFKPIWWWLLLPVAILGALFFWLLLNKKKRQPKNRDYKLETNPDTPILGNTPNGTNPGITNSVNPSVETSDATQLNASENISDGSPNSTLATGAAGTVLLANSGDQNSDIQNENVVDETGGLDLEAPAAIVHNFHPQVDDVTVSAANSDVSISEQVSDTNSEENNENTVTASKSNLLGNIASAGNIAAAAGAALAAGTGASLWSRFSNKEDNNQDGENQNTDAVSGVIEDKNSQTIEVADTQDIATNQSFHNQNQTENIVTEPVLPVVQINSTSPSVSEITDNGSLETGKLVDKSELPTVKITNPLTEEPQVDVSQPDNTSENQSGNKQNLFDNLTSKSNAGIAGAAVVAGAGATLWSNFSNQDSHQDGEEKIQESVKEDTANTNQTTDYPLPDLWTSEEETQTETSLQTPENISTELDQVPNAAEALTQQANTKQIQDTVPKEIEKVNTADINTAETNTAETNTIDPTAVAGVVGVGAAGLAGFASIPNQNTALTQTNITLESRTPKWAYASWNLSTTDRQEVHENGDSQLMLRLYDVTDIDLSYQSPNLVQQYESEQTINHRYVAIPKSDRNYMAEIGYITQDQRWQSLGRSEITRVFSRPQEGFWFEADAELIIHGATEPGSDVTIAGSSVKVKPDGTFHLRVPFTQELIDYLIVASNPNGNNAKTIHMKFRKESDQI